MEGKSLTQKDTNRKDGIDKPSNKEVVLLKKDQLKSMFDQIFRQQNNSNCI